MDQKARGFSIVELLIIIVVVGILAAVSTVGYSRLADNAHASSAQSAAAQASRKIATYYVENGTPPPALTTIGIANSGSVIYQYSPSETSNGQFWCVTATSSDRSFYASASGQAAREGGCVGHTQNSNAGWVMWGNMLANPSFEDTNGWNFASSRTRVQVADAKYGQWVMQLSQQSSNNHLYPQLGHGVEPGKKYRISVWARKTSSDITGTFGHYMSTSATPANPSFNLAELSETSWTELASVVTATSTALVYAPYITAGTGTGLIQLDGISIVEHN